MPLSNPRPLADFMDRLRITEFEWSPRDSRQIDGQGSGQILQIEQAPDLWTAKASVGDNNAGVRQVRALLNSLVPVGRFALIYDPIAQYPAYDPDGSILGARVVTLAAIGATRDTIQLGGLPPGYQLTEGDMIELRYGAGPMRRQLLEVHEPATANGSGITGSFAIYPHLRPAITTAALINLKKPALKMMRVSHNSGTSRPGAHGGMSIEFIEKVV